MPFGPYPQDQKAVRVAVETFRQNPQLDTATMITELGIGEALVSILDEQGRPTMVGWCLLNPVRFACDNSITTLQSACFFLYRYYTGECQIIISNNHQEKTNA